jgi:hypothetical protein
VNLDVTDPQHAQAPSNSVKHGPCPTGAILAVAGTKPQIRSTSVARCGSTTVWAAPEAFPMSPFVVR